MMQYGALEEMVDHFRIRQLLERYCRGVDRLDKEMIDSVYWPESYDNHGPYQGPGKDFGEYLVKKWAGLFASTMHIIAQSNIRVRDQLAAGDTYLIAYHRLERNGSVTVEKAVARYVDEFEKRADEWRIMNRTVVMEHLQLTRDVETSGWNVSDFVRGRQDRGDLSYYLLGM